MKNPSLDAGRRRSALPRLAAHLDRDASEARADAEHYARQGNISMHAASMAAVDACERAAAEFREEYAKLTSGPRKILVANYDLSSISGIARAKEQTNG